MIYKHQDNVLKVKEFLYEHNKAAWRPKEVAERLGVSENAVKNIMKVLFRVKILRRRKISQHFTIMGKTHMFPVTYYIWNLSEHQTVKRT